MGADRARRSFDPSRRYRSVVAQQGRVTLEADDNEAEEIRAAESRAELLDIVGPTGTPDDGFKITVPAPGAVNALDFGIAAGTLYVGGLRVEQPAPTTYEGQKPAEWHDFPTPATAQDQPIARLQVAGPQAAGPQAAGVRAAGPQVAGPAVAGPQVAGPQVAGPHLERPPVAAPVEFDELIYLGVTEHEVSAVEDHVLREVALGGPDTSARTRLVTRVMRAPATTTDCDVALVNRLTGSLPGAKFDTDTMRLESSAQLKVDFVPVADAGPDPCEPTAQPGFLGGENQLIRVQVTGGDKPSMLWGYDNASFLYRGVVSNDGTSIVLAGKPVDVFHRPRAHQWVEVLGIAENLDSDDSIAAIYGLPYELDGYDDATDTITLHTLVTQPTGPDVFVRMWENRIPFISNGAVSTELVRPEHDSTGVVVSTTGTPLPGDYWVIGVRPSTPGDILPARLKEGFQSPDGPHRWATSLAMIHWSAPNTARASTTAAAASTTSSTSPGPSAAS